MIDPNINNLNDAAFIVLPFFMGLIIVNIYFVGTKTLTLSQALYIIITIYFQSFPRKYNAFFSRCTVFLGCLLFCVKVIMVVLAICCY